MYARRGSRSNPAVAQTLFREVRYERLSRYDIYVSLPARLATPCLVTVAVWRPRRTRENDEKIICEMHHNAMLQGARWVAYIESHEVLIGSDAPPILTEVSVSHAGSSNLSNQPVFMKLCMSSTE